MAQPLPPVQMLWVGGPLSTLERLSLTSFLRNGHEVHLYSYGRPANTPKGLVVKDAGEILALPKLETSVETDAASTVEAVRFSDRFRSKLLHERGGIWSDIDVICLKPLAFANGMDYFFASQVMPAQPGDEGRMRVRASNCMMKVPVNSPVMHDCLLGAADEASGPTRLHNALEKFNLLGALLNPNLFCPIPFWNVATLLTGPTTLPPDACGVHFWSESWRRNFFDRNASYDSLSLFERLKTHYLGQRARKES